MNCPICHKTEVAKGISLREAKNQIEGNFTIYHCENCHVGFVYPQPSQKELMKLYDEPFYARPLVENTFARKLGQLVFKPRRMRIEGHMKPGKLLDYGCGDGQFVEYMSAHDWDVTGYDPSPTAKERAKRNGKIRILSTENEVSDLEKGSFNCITLWQVLEHIPDPVALLTRLTPLLKQDGLIFISVPNIESIQAKIAGDTWWGLDVPRHLFHFSPSSIRYVLKKAGFSNTHINHLSFQYSPYALYHSLLDQFFTRRHFLSDLVKWMLPPDITVIEILYNILMLVILTPFLLVLGVVETLISPLLKRGAFIEISAIAQK